ncbi:sulfatase-like hydrolase/transferase [Spongiimicrobium sp. 3-5]|uniref:sulfatase-like hydrolase/transferase n=1 Tax=Spongiimicrobium sp. 3-5 TaxID=3332596 RepID=UPI00398133BF
MNKIGTRLVLAIAILALFFSCKETTKQVEKKAVKPNILMVMVDQMRFDRFGAMGDTIVKTPNIDALLQDGLLFKNTYCPSPVCAPSRASVKTGIFPPGNGMVTNWVPFKEKVAGTTSIDQYLLTERLKSQGYNTGLVGKLHFVPAADEFGFDFKALNDAPYSVYADDDKNSDYVKWLQTNHFKHNEKDIVATFDRDENYYPDSIYKFIMGSGWRTKEQHDIPWTAQESMDFIENSSPDKPFFLFTSFFGPHQPYLAPTPWDTMYNPDDMVLGPRFYSDMESSPIFTMSPFGKLSKKLRTSWDERKYKEVLAAYYGQISMIDHYLGKMFDQLKEKGLWENTWIVFLADHGDFNTAYGTFFKGEMYDVSAKIPLLIKPAAGYGKKGIREELVNSLDVYGTLLDVAGDKEWADLPQMESRSLLPIIREGNTASEWENKVYSIIGEDPNKNLCMLRLGPLKMIRKAISEEQAIYELYDFDQDPLETQNVFDDPNYAEVQQKLKTELDAWWKKQGERYPKELDKSFQVQ